MSIESINPATGAVVQRYQEASPADVDRVVGRAQAAFFEWRHAGFAERARAMRKAAEVLAARKAEYAHLMAVEMGKPIVQGEAEVDKCAWVCTYYADYAQALLATQPRETDATKSYVRF